MVIRNIPVYISKGNRIDFELAEYLGDNTIEQAITVVVKMMKGVFRAITVPEVGSRAHLHTGDQKGGRNSRLVHGEGLQLIQIFMSESDKPRSCPRANNQVRYWVKATMTRL
ncbi:hypothetical protein CIHG_05572 [Coccidioides immitis H538.4]|uniref:Uncharacterized protein n=3 Tax=Coccidioides immitis TaxID=5501 RepID=A0A0J8TYX2_COCIT|nr:hypothetical protein CIRG_05803 [Coccidioides immitis RMSCC 2394]KMU79177.1 hypothetical protein CISG_07540 [Coccidioides immitis RMSCC 3703]KMU87803.1 hypothetical protein CIHG_05572 [Coccidioides immitis H538.4]